MYLIGIDVGGMSIKGGIIDSESGKILVQHAIPTTTQYTKDYSISKDIAKVIDIILAEANMKIDDIVGIGIGQPGSIDSERGVVRYSNNIAIENVPVVDELKVKYNLPIYISNDANCAALGEYVFGAGRGYKDIVFITLGTGVGSGIIIDGKLFEGRSGAGAEAGHMIINVDGEKCNCGSRGCWETYASATALIRQTKAALDDPANKDSYMHEVAKEEGKVSGKTAFIAAKKGDKAGQAVVDQYIKYIAVGLVNMANIFRPDAILIGGGISKEKEYLTKPLQAQLDACTYGGKYNPRVIVKTASLQNDAGILGAAALVIKNN